MSAGRFNRQPELPGRLIHLRPLRPDDWNALFGVASDPEIWAMHPMHDRWQEPVFRDFFADALEQGGALAVIDRRTNAIVGSSRFQNHEAADGGSVEIGWTFLARKCWGKGHNREMKRLMAGHALARLARVDFRVGEDNLRSRRALEKIGARLSPHRIDLAQHDGREITHLIYEMTLADYAANLAGD